MKYISAMLGGSHKHKKMKQLQTVELKVRMDCEGCEHKVKRALSSLKGLCFITLDSYYWSCQFAMSCIFFLNKMMMLLCRSEICGR